MSELGPQVATVETKTSTEVPEASSAADESHQLDLGLDLAGESDGGGDRLAGEFNEAADADDEPDLGLDLAGAFNEAADADDEPEPQPLEDQIQQANTEIPQLGELEVPQQPGQEVPANETASQTDASETTMADNSSAGSRIGEMNPGGLTEKFNDGPTKKDEDKKDGEGAPPLTPPEPSGPTWEIEGIPSDPKPKGQGL